jgi:DNA-binding NtrC family response regulator
MVREGTFREDLFHRLTFLQVTMPPLRERGRDILTIARRYLAAEEMPRTFSRRAEQALLRHPWPGNVRELQKVIFRAALQCPDTIDLSALSPLLIPPTPLPEWEHLSRGARAALLVVQRLGKAATSKIAAALNVSNITAFRYLNHLAEVGLVEKRGHGRSTAYFFDP